ncbi:MAG: AAA family ATPase, partial [Spirulinaceae cyanobacterium]
MTAPHALLQNIQATLDRIVVGQSIIVEQLLVALLGGGHVILEGVPGTGKTLLVKVMARLLQSEFRRIQLTPDVLPADIVGTHIFDLNNRTFSLQRGPIFTDILLADEINRTPPKTQSALLEAMEEQQVTLEGETLALPDGFWVVATQNPLEFEGTYPLPEAQLDRFLFKIVVDYPAPEAEKQMLLNVQRGFRAKRLDLLKVEAIATIPQILQARQQVRQVQVAEPVLDYVLALVARSRQ